MSMMYLTKKEMECLNSALHVYAVEKMRVLAQTKTESYLFPDPEEVREKLYDEIDFINDLEDRFFNELR